MKQLSTTVEIVFTEMKGIKLREIQAINKNVDTSD